MSNNNDVTMTQTVHNLPDNYQWESNVMVITNREMLLERVAWCKEQGISLRVKASGWSCNKFLDPTSSDGKKGVNILLSGDFDGVLAMDEHTVTAGAATERGPLYAELDKTGRQLVASGECFTESESQQVGGLVANAVHDTMQNSFSPETVIGLEAVVFDETTGKPVIKSFSALDGDAFYSFFGGMGMTGIIVSATLIHIAKLHYHFRPYLPGSKYDDDPSFDVGSEALSLQELVDKYNIKVQGSSCRKRKDLTIGEKDGFEVYSSSFANALKDLALKHKMDKKDVCAMFFLFPSPDESNDDGDDELADGSVPVATQKLGRYYKMAKGDTPEYTVTQNQFDDISALMGKAYCQEVETVDALMPVLGDIQNSVAKLKWQYANLMNTKPQTDDQKNLALSSEHWAYMETDIAHTTGPNYVYLWAKASEFYIKEEDIDEFVKILQPAVLEMLATSSNSEGAAAASMFADCRYAFKSDTAFMSGFYKHNRLAIDIGCTKHHFSNELYTKMTTTVLQKCKEANIEVRIHTGKFYVYDESLTHYMYDEETRTRFGAIVDKHDPNAVFAPPQWRDLFAITKNDVVDPINTPSQPDSESPGQPLPSVPSPFSMPFYYSSLSNFGVYYLVAKEKVLPYLNGTGLVPAIIDSKALVSFNFQLYTGHFSAGPGDTPDEWPTTAASVTQEVELNIVAVPESAQSRVAQVSFEQFVLGEEQTKLMGNHRVHVPCDSDVAIQAGEECFGEPKFKTSFNVNLASRNPSRKADSVTYQPAWSSEWGFRINDPDDSTKSICTCTAQLAGRVSVPANCSPITEYGVHEGKLIGCRWNILQPMDTYLLSQDPSDQSHLSLKFGESSHAMTEDMKALLEGEPARAVRVFNSPAAAIQSRAYYPA